MLYTIIGFMLFVLVAVVAYYGGKANGQEQGYQSGWKAGRKMGTASAGDPAFSGTATMEWDTTKKDGSTNTDTKKTGKKSTSKKSTKKKK